MFEVTIMLMTFIFAILGVWYLSRVTSSLSRQQSFQYPELKSSHQDKVSMQVQPGLTSSWKGFRNFIVTNKQYETEQVCTITLKPQDGRTVADFHPGQYLMFRLSIPGKKKPIQRCYSLSAGPDSQQYQITVKQLPKGQGSNYLHQQLEVGQVLEATAPQGHFYLQDTMRPVVMIAGGIGITPFLSMLDVLSLQRDRPAYLFYSMRNGRDHVAKEQLQSLSRSLPHVRVITIYTRPDPIDQLGLDYDSSQRLSVESMSHLLKLSECEFYICGSLSLTQTFRDELTQAGVDDQWIHAEGFGGPSLPATRKPQSNPTDHQDQPASKYKVQFQKSGVDVVWENPQDSLLDVAERHGVEIEAVCRSGNCGACKTRLLAGRVQHREGCQSGHDSDACLPCQAVPQGDIILNA